MSAASVKPSPKRRRGSGNVRLHRAKWVLTLADDTRIELGDRELSKAQAHALADKVIADRAAGIDVTPAMRPAERTFEDLSAEYLKSVGHRFTPRRRKEIDSHLRNHLLPALGDVRLGAMTGELIRKYVEAKRTGAAPVPDGVKAALARRTVRHQLTVVNQMFAWAADPARGWVSHNPVPGNMPKAKRTTTKPIEPELTAMIVSLTPAGTLRRMVLVLFCLGLRIGELLALKDRSWNSATRVLTVDDTQRRLEDQEALRARRWAEDAYDDDGGKTHSATRNLPTGQQMAAEVLDAQISSNLELMPDLAVRSLDGPLFPTSKGTAWQASNFRNRVWQPALMGATVKLLTDRERAYWLSLVPDPYRLAAELVAVSGISVQGVIAARASQFDGEHLTYTDMDGVLRVERLPDELAERLAAHVRAGGRSRLFPGARNSPIKLARFLDEAFVEPLREARLLNDRRVHRTRHTFSSQAAREPGITEAELMARLGHSTPEMTRHYTHLFTEQQRKPADVMAMVSPQAGVSEPPAQAA